ncbi:MAG: hypothetical protein LBE55_00265, partial [Clostridiales bacterium]|nr:hypothetical protein [Clostridiales bacterium]
MRTRSIKSVIIAACLLFVLVAAFAVISFMRIGGNEAALAAEPATIEMRQPVREAQEATEEIEKEIEEEIEEETPKDALAALVAYAQRRADGAAVYGEIIRAGRHYPRDIEALHAAIAAARHALGNNLPDE